MFAFGEDRAVSLKLGLGRRSAVPGPILNQEALKNRGKEDTESYCLIFLCELCGSVFQNVFWFSGAKAASDFIRLLLRGFRD